MSRRLPDSRVWRCLGCVSLGWLLSSPGSLLAQSATNMIGTAHDLSVSGPPGGVKALTETRICVFCHTPHSATSESPLWNRDLPPQTYTVYASPTLKAGPLPQPYGPTKLCLSCHDGTVAMGTVLNPSAGIGMTGGGGFPAGSAYFGLDLSGHHPVSFHYRDSLPNPELVSPAPPSLTYGDTDEIHCTTCHDPHNDQWGEFLVFDNAQSALCTTCHQMSGWTLSSHATSTERLPETTQRLIGSAGGVRRLHEAGCEICHASHGAPTRNGLLRFSDLPPEVYSCTTAGCHSQTGAAGAAATAPTATGLPELGQRPVGRGADIGRQVRKLSAHHEQSAALAGVEEAEGAAATGTKSVRCQSCHDSHAVNDRRAEPPYASGLLEKVAGVDRNGLRVSSVTYEYEVCFKCHGDYSADFELVPRVVASNNARRDFDPQNPSYHPVLDPSRALGSPSIPSSLEPDLSPLAVIACTSCHRDDEGGSRGPHGSSYPPILGERYETADGTGESYAVYALCYRCHERQSILADASFRKKTVPRTASGGGHSGHLAAGAPCAVCHDAHGVDVGFAGGVAETGDHQHLINFDVRVVQPIPGGRYPIYASTGLYSGSCTLVCHGVVHDQQSYP